MPNTAFGGFNYNGDDALARLMYVFRGLKNREDLVENEFDMIRCFYFTSDMIAADRILGDYRYVVTPAEVEKAR